MPIARTAPTPTLSKPLKTLYKKNEANSMIAWEYYYPGKEDYDDDAGNVNAPIVYCLGKVAPASAQEGDSVKIKIGENIYILQQQVASDNLQDLFYGACGEDVDVKYIFGYNSIEGGEGTVV